MKQELLQAILNNSMVVKHSHGAFGEHESYDVVSAEKVADNVLVEVLKTLDPAKNVLTHEERANRWDTISILCRHFGVRYESKS